MSYEVIKTIRGRRYRYLQKTYRSGGKVRTQSIYLGPVDGRKKRKLDLGGLAPGLLALVIHIAKHGTKSPTYKTKNRPPDPRSRAHMLERERAKWEAKLDDAKHGWARERSKPASTKEWREFMEHITARQTAQDAPGRMQDAQAKTFTVDDEIDARQAKFHETQEEVNASRGYDPAPTEPPDAPDDTAPSEP